MRTALRRLGYRPMKRKGVWGKTVGWQLFTFEEDRGEITLWFKGVRGGKFHRHGADVLVKDEVCPDYEECFRLIKYFEADVLNLFRGSYSDSSFEFSSIGDEFDD